MDGFASLGVTSHETQPVLLPGAPLVSGPSLACWMHEYGVFKVSLTADVHGFYDCFATDSMFKMRCGIIV